jgi:Mrp family chromosome partitioning ATPase
MPGLEKIRHVILVLSGKGGVGKSTVACQLALWLAAAHSVDGRAARVGLLDTDLCGPSVATICGVKGVAVQQDPATGVWTPIAKEVRRLSNPVASTDAAPTATTGSVTGDDTATNTLRIMSIASLLPSEKDAVVWRGPRKDAMIKQFLQGVEWGELDYLIVDTPPGTSDEHLTLCEILAPYNPTGCVIVTTPQALSTDDVRKELHFCGKLGLRCLGIVENMCGFVCPGCESQTFLFSRGGGEQLAAQYETPFLGRVPLDVRVRTNEDQGVDVFSDPATGRPLEGGAPAALADVIRALQIQVARVEALMPQ